MRTITTSVDIQAAPEIVWDILIDGSGHAEWDPHIESITGRFEAGERLEVKFRDSMTFKPVVQTVEPRTTLEWLGRLGLPGIFDGRHRWDLEPTTTGTRLTQSEQFTGILVPFLGSLLKKTEDMFQASNKALAGRAEARLQHGS